MSFQGSRADPGERIYPELSRRLLSTYCEPIHLRLDAG